MLFKWHDSVWPTMLKYICTSAPIAGFNLAKEDVEARIEDAGHCICSSPTYYDLGRKSIRLTAILVNGKPLGDTPTQLRLLDYLLKSLHCYCITDDSRDYLLAAVFPQYAPGSMPKYSADALTEFRAKHNACTKEVVAGTALSAVIGGAALGFQRNGITRDAGTGWTKKQSVDSATSFALEAMAVWGLLYRTMKGAGDRELEQCNHVRPRSPYTFTEGAFFNGLRHDLQRCLPCDNYADPILWSSGVGIATYWSRPTIEFFEDRKASLLRCLPIDNQPAVHLHPSEPALPRVPGLALNWGHSIEGEAAPKWGVYVQVRNAKRRRYLKRLNYLFPYTSDADSKHMTVHMADVVWWALHSQNPKVRVGEALETTSFGKRLRRLNRVLQGIPVGTPQPLAISMVIACCFHMHKDIIYNQYVGRGLLYRTVDEQRAMLKDYSTLVRKSSVDLDGNPINDKQVAALAYYDLMFGRSEHVTDWQTEVKNRCGNTLHIQHPKNTSYKYNEWRPDLASLDSTQMKEDDDFYDALRHELRQICRPLVTKRNTKETLERFVRRRHEWMASGSSAGHVVTLANQDKGAPVQVKGQKRAWAESISVADVKEFMRTQVPKEIAHASEKMENGKARAIYGVEPMHYLINTYATKGFEERLHLVPGLEKGLSGSALVQSELRRAHLTGEADVECTMLDYADFNRHHTPKAQAMIFETLAQLGSEVGATQDWISANKWVSKAKSRMSAIFPTQSKAIPVNQGMFSGTRSTDLINTILNLAYYKVAERHVAQTYGIQPKELYHVHQGDDVWISNKNRVWARLIFYTLNQMGFLFQERKQMFGTGRGEYLRVLYSNGEGYGYFARAMSNYILRPVQQKMPMDPQAWAQTISDGVALLQRRGLSQEGALSLYANGTSYWVRARAHPKDVAPVSIPMPMLQAIPAQGGLGCTMPGHLWVGGDVRHLGELPRLTSTLSTANMNLPSKMTDDWIEHVSSQVAPTSLRRQFDAEEIKATIHKLNYVDVVEQVQVERGWLRYKRDLAALSQKIKQQAAPLSDLTRQLAGVRVDGVNAGDAMAQVLPYLDFARALPPMRLHWYNFELQTMWSVRQSELAPTSFTKVSDSVQAAITKSRFKNENLTAKAYHISRHEAVAVIMTEAIHTSSVAENVARTVSLAYKSGNYEAVDALIQGCGSLIPLMKSVTNEGLWQYTEQSLVELLITAAPGTQYRNLLEMIQSQAWFTGTHLQLLAAGPKSRGHPVIY